MGTPFSGLSAYCTVAQLASRADIRTLGDLLSDDSTQGRLTPTQVQAIGAMIGGTITAATQTTPIQVTSPSHGQVSGNNVTIGGAAGLTAINGSWVITLVDANNFTLNGSIGAGTPTAYVANSATWHQNLVLADLLREASGMVEMACLRGERYSPADLAGLTGNAAESLAGLVAGITLWLLWERRPTRLATMQLPLRAQMAMDQLAHLEAGDRIFGILEVASAGVASQPEFMTPNDLEYRNFTSVISKRYFGSRSQFHVPGPGGPTGGD